MVSVFANYSIVFLPQQKKRIGIKMARCNTRYAKNNDKTHKILEKSSETGKFWKYNPKCSEEHRRYYKQVFYLKKLEGESIGERE